MTTKVHIVNFGPNVVEVRNVDPATQQQVGSTPSLFAQQSVDLYVHSTQSVNISERKPEAGEIYIKRETQPVHPQHPAYSPGITIRMPMEDNTQGSTNITVENEGTSQSAQDLQAHPAYDEGYRMGVLAFEQKRQELLGDIKLMRGFLMGPYTGHPEIKAKLIEKYAH